MHATQNASPAPQFEKSLCDLYFTKAKWRLGPRHTVACTRCTDRPDKRRKCAIKRGVLERQSCVRQEYNDNDNNNGTTVTTTTTKTAVFCLLKAATHSTGQQRQKGTKGALLLVWQPMTTVPCTNLFGSQKYPKLRVAGQI
jgi:hypothetical protein